MRCADYKWIFRLLSVCARKRLIISALMLGLSVARAAAAGSSFSIPAPPAIPNHVFDITHYGAIGDGTTTNTAAIQAAINVAADGGGGTVEVPAGVFLCGPIRLASGVD